MDSMEASVKRVEIQVGQLAEQMYKQETGKLPSQPEQAKAITVIQSDEEVPKNLPDNSNVLLSSTGNLEGENSTLKGDDESNTTPNELPKKEIGETSNIFRLHKSMDPYRPPIPPMHQFKEKNQDAQYSNTLALFSKINCNLPLLDVIKNSPTYDPIFRNFIIKKSRSKENEMSEIASPMIQQHLPLKMKDPGSFNINITMGDKRVFKAMLDLGAGINLMPYSVYLQLGLGKFKETRMTLQLANGSIQHPKGIVENLLVQVGKFIVPVDFVVLEMDKNFLKDKEHTIILGRPFMATTKTTIEVHNRKLSMTVFGETIQFENFQPSPIPSNIQLQDSISNRIEAQNIEWRGKDKLINLSRDDAYKECIKHSNYKNSTWRTKAHFEKDKGGDKQYNYTFNPLDTRSVTSC